MSADNRATPNTVAQALSLATALHVRGDLAGARRQAEAALVAQPDNLSALRMAGVLQCQTGDPAKGAGLLSRALRANPDDEATRLNFVQTLIDSGRLDEADTICGSALGRPSTDLLKLRALIARARGHLDQALNLLELAAESAPDDYASWNNLGNALHETGELDRAIAALTKARQLRPDDALVCLNLGRALATAQRLVESVAVLRSAAEIAANDPLVHLELARVLNRAGANEQALQPIAHAARLDRGNGETFVLMGVIFANLAELAKAEQAYRFAIEVAPHHAPAYLGLGILLEQANRLDELRALVEEMNRRAMDGDERRFIQALLLRRDGKLEEALAHAQGTSIAGSVDANMRAHFIGEVADRLDLPEIAFQAFEAMNRATAATPTAQRFDGSDARRDIEQMASITTPEWYATWRDADIGDDPPAPAFLVGFLRSGTTLLDTMLMGHPDTHVIEEEPLLARVAMQLQSLDKLAAVDTDRASALRALYFEEMGKVASPVPRALIIDKNPLASLKAPLIHRLFPDARFIFAVRHPCDVVLSCFMQNFKINQSMANFLTLDTAARYYDRVMDYWSRCQTVFPLKVHMVRYEDLVADQPRELAALTDFLGLPWDDGLLKHQATAADRGYIRTPSYAQVTEQIYTRATGRWERYREQLAPILPILAPWVERFNYEPIVPLGPIRSQPVTE